MVRTLPTLKASDIQRGLAATVNRVMYGGERVVLTRRGVPCAAIVSLADLELLEGAESIRTLGAATAEAPPGPANERSA